MYFIFVILGCFVIIWGLIETIFYDYQRTKFLDMLEAGQHVKIAGNHAVIEAVYENRVLISNIYHEAKWVDKRVIDPEVPYLSALRFIYSNIAG